MKTCKKCGESKEATTEFFYASKTNKDRLSADCKVCWKEYYESNKDKIVKNGKQYRADNKSKILERKKQYRETNKKKYLHIESSTIVSMRRSWPNALDGTVDAIRIILILLLKGCLLYTSDAADEEDSVDLGGRRIIKKKKKKKQQYT